MQRAKESPEHTDSHTHMHTMEARKFPFYCSTFHWRKVSRICMSFLLKVTSSLWSFMAYHHHFYCSYHPLSIISPPFHCPLLYVRKMPGTCSHIKLNNSYKFKRRGIWTLRSDIWGILRKQNACSIVFDVWQLYWQYSSRVVSYL